MKRICRVGLATLFLVPAICLGVTIEIERIRDDSATLVPGTGETYFSVVVDVNVLAADNYSFLLELGQVDAHTGTFLSAGRHELTIPCYSRELSRLTGTVSNVTITIHSPSSTGPAMTFQTSKTHALGRRYVPSHFKRREARISDTKQSHETIAISLAEITLPTEHRPGDDRLALTVEPVEPTKLFDRPCNSSAYRLFLARPPETTAYIAVSEGRDTAFIVENTETFNQYASTLTPAPAGASQTMAQAKAFMAICHLAYDPTVLTEIPKSERPRSGRPKDMSVSQWFEKNEAASPFHAPEFSHTEEAQILRFFSWQRLVGIIRHHEYRMTPNGEIVSHNDKELATGVGDWWID